MSGDEKPPTIRPQHSFEAIDLLYIANNMRIVAQRSLGGTLSGIVDIGGEVLFHPFDIPTDISRGLKGLEGLLVDAQTLNYYVSPLVAPPLRVLAASAGLPINSSPEMESSLAFVSANERMSQRFVPLIRDLDNAQYGDPATRWEARGKLGTDFATLFLSFFTPEAAVTVGKVAGSAVDLGRMRFFANGVEKMLGADEVKFTQESVSYLKNRSGISYSLGDITQSMTHNGWVEEPIDVVKVKGGYSTLDNSRVLAARKAGIDVRARVHSKNAKVSPNIRFRFKNPKNPKIEAQRWKDAVAFRIMRQSPAFRKDYVDSAGTYIEPRVINPKNWPE